MKIIVTGGAGFIASHIADEYIGKGHTVAIIDNLLTGSRANVNPKATFYKADIRDLAQMEKIFKKEKPEIVNHHAAIADVTRSLRDPIPTLETNVLGTTNVLLAFGKYGRAAGGKKRRFIFSSTGGAIYGSPKKLPADESTPADPLSPYALSKQLDEEIIKFYASHFGLTYFILRYANIYGPRQNPKGEAGVVAIFGRLMKSGVQPTIFGDGTKARDYVYVSDVVRANVAALRKAPDETANIGWGKAITDQAIFDTIANATGYHGQPIYAPYRTGEVYRTALSAKKAQRLLGWKPKVALQEGVQKTIDSL